MASKPPFDAPPGDYAGDVSSQDAWDALAKNKDAIFVDVRTSIEWQLIGKPDLSSINHEPIYLQWVTMQGVNENFVDELKGALEERDVKADTPIYFMCQSGGRSKMSAMQCTQLGFNNCYNVADGFEGDLDGRQHRNSVNGWKFAGLPWTQG